MDLLATSSRKLRRRNFTPEFRKALAQRACESGISVSQLAQDNGINANMLFKWRRELLASKMGCATPQQVMLPVTVVGLEPNPSQAKSDRYCLSDTGIPSRLCLVKFQVQVTGDLKFHTGIYRPSGLSGVISSLKRAFFPLLFFSKAE